MHPARHAPDPIRPLAWNATPAQILARWPAHSPVMALVTGSRGDAGERWSIIAAPGRSIGTWAETAHAFGAAPRSSAPRAPDTPPFVSGWIGWIGYEAGREIEPAAAITTGRPTDDRGWPVVHLARCEGAFVHDAVTGRWFMTGDPGAPPEIDLSAPARAPEACVEALTSQIDRRAYEGLVAQAVEYIRAGDVFQVNIARRLSAAFAGSPRALFARVLGSMRPRFAGLIEGPIPGRAVVSMSPELFLRDRAGSGRVVTKPIKGTAPGKEAPDGLAGSEKDRAELAMIVDLMRNDLGRVCEFGSVRVAQARAIERHGSRDLDAGVWHGVATVQGRLRSGVTVADLLAASLAPGSVTGAPKVRAMQIIEEMEPVRRGPYCGAVGFVDDSGAATFNVAIRTAAVTGAPTAGAGADGWTDIEGNLDYFVGAGIVADSDPALEWAETEAKAAGFRRACESACARERAHA